MTKKLLIILTFLALVSMGSCISKKKLVYTKYYLLEPPEETSELPRRSPESDIKLELSSVNVSPAYGSTKIVNRNRSNEIVYFSYHEWAVLPDVSIAEFALKFLRGKAFFSEVSGNIFGDGPDYLLEMDVSRIEMLSLSDETSAHVVLNFRYIDALTGQVVLRHRFDERISLPEKDVNLLAKSVSSLLWESLGQLHSKIVDYHTSNS